MIIRKTYISQRLQTLLKLTSLLTARSGALRMLFYVRRKKLTFLSFGALADLALAVDAIEKNNVPGMIIEAGAALGGSSILITKAKKPGRVFHIYDTFEMIPSPTDADGTDAHDRYNTIKSGKAEGFGHDTYYGYKENLYQQVIHSFSSAGLDVEQNHVCLIKGLIEDTMQIDRPVALAHIDCDWYSPVRVSLEQIIPNLLPGGRIIIDDYDHWSGARKAVDEYFKSKANAYEFQRKARLHIIKK